MLPLCDYDVESLASDLRDAGHNPAHAVTILRRYYKTAGSGDFEGLALGKNLQHELQRDAIRRSRITARRESPDQTVKFLIGLDDSQAVEAVMMPAFRADRAAG